MPDDWGVQVNEIRIFATCQGVEWWLMFSARFRSTARMTCLVATPAGCVWHVACDGRKDAQRLAEVMIENGVPRSAVDAKQAAQHEKAGTPPDLISGLIFS